MRHTPNFRYTARGRPQSRHRRLSRVENFGFFKAFAIFDLLAIWRPSKNSHFQIHAVFQYSVHALIQITLLIGGRYAAPLPFASAVLNGMPRPRKSSRDSSLL